MHDKKDAGQSIRESVGQDGTGKGQMMLVRMNSVY